MMICMIYILGLCVDVLYINYRANGEYASAVIKILH